MISVDNIHLSLGGRSILHGVNLSIREGECLAVLGPNGCGKTTLLKVIAGIEAPDSGEVRLPNRSTTGYLPQEMELQATHSLRDELLDAFSEVRSALQEMTVLEKRMGETEPGSPEHTRIIERYAECSHLVEHQDGYSLEARVQRIAAGLGFSVDDMSRPCSEFSGGWQMRILLAKLLLQKPDVLLLDEPTNHLDLESTLWLEDWIRGCGRTVILVTHERATMDRLANRIVCLERGIAEVYPGDYSKYLELSERKREAQWQAYNRQQKEIAAIKRFIRRFRATASRASLVQSRIKQLDKIERIEPPFHPNSVHFDFPPAPRSYRDVVTITDLGHAYGDLRVFADINLTIYRGEKIGLVGMNGAGKSTLLRIIAGQEEPTEGECLLGKNVERAHFAQYDTAGLTSDTTMLQDMESSAPIEHVGRVRDLLGTFLFTGDDVDKPLKALSGGERTRFRLAQMLFSRANLLLLDEPTNHLDISSRATVERALQQYAGTVIIVSHDRVLMDRVTQRIIEIENGAVRDYPGKYSDYLTYKEEVVAGQTPADGLSASSKQESAKERRIRKRKERKAHATRIRSTKKKIDQIEHRIERCEKQVAELNQAMVDPAAAADYGRLASLGKDHRRLTEEHHSLLEQWDELHERLQTLEESETVIARGPY